MPVTVNYATGRPHRSEPRDRHRRLHADVRNLTFSPGAALTQTVNVPVVNDTVWEADAERFDVQRDEPGATAQTASAPGTILDDEAHPPVVSVGSVTVREGEVTKQVWVPVTLDRPAATATLVRWSTANGTAAAPSDYAAQANQQVVFEAGQVSKFIKIFVVGDTLNEGNETFKVNLFSPFGLVLGTATGTVTILDDDAPTVGDAGACRSTTSRVIEGDSGIATIDATVELNMQGAGEDHRRRITTSAGPRPRASTTPLLAQGRDRVKGASPTTSRSRSRTISSSRPTRRFSLASSSIVGATGRQDVRDVTIVDNDNPLPTGPTGITAVKSRDAARRHRGVVERRDDAARRLAAHRLRVPGLDERRHDLRRLDRRPVPGRARGSCTRAAQDVSCTYQVRGREQEGRRAARRARPPRSASPTRPRPR